MQPKQLPTTSLAANNSFTSEMREKHHSKILKALNELKKATYEEISIKLGMDKHQVGRRLCELQRDQLVYKPGTQKNTSTGRKAFEYALVNQISTYQNGIQSELFG